MIKLSISFVQLGYARVAARVGTALGMHIHRGNRTEMDREQRNGIYMHSSSTPRLEPPACVVAGLGATHHSEK